MHVVCSKLPRSDSDRDRRCCNAVCLSCAQGKATGISRACGRQSNTVTESTQFIAKASLGSCPSRLQFLSVESKQTGTGTGANENTDIVINIIIIICSSSPSFHHHPFSLQKLYGHFTHPVYVASRYFQSSIYFFVFWLNLKIASRNVSAIDVIMLSSRLRNKS